MVAAALSAAVTTTPSQETAPTSQGQPVRKKSQPEPQPLFGREGSGGRGASLREAASPPRISAILPHQLSEREREGGGLSPKGLLPRKTTIYKERMIFVSKIDVVRSAMMQAMKDKDKERKESLSLLLSALKNKAIDKRADLTEEEENAVILKEIKQCQEAIDTAPAGRDDVIAENTARIAVYQEFAPKMMNADEITAVLNSVLSELGITAPTPKEKGLIMKTLMPRVKGKADSALVNQVLTAKMQG